MATIRQAPSKLLESNKIGLINAHGVQCIVPPDCVVDVGRDPRSGRVNRGQRRGFEPERKGTVILSEIERASEAEKVGLTIARYAPGQN